MKNVDHFAGAGKVIAWFDHFANADKMVTSAKKTWQRNKLSRQKMRKKIIEKNLKKALLENGAFSRALFEFELEDRVEAYPQSKHEDGDKYLFVIAEKSNEIAMMLIDENDEVHVNEEARALLMKNRRDVPAERLYVGNQK